MMGFENTSSVCSNEEGKLLTAPIPIPPEMTREEMEVPPPYPLTLFLAPDYRVGQYEYEQGLVTIKTDEYDAICAICGLVPHHPVANTYCQHVLCDVCLNKNWKKCGEVVNEHNVLKCSECKRAIMAYMVKPLDDWWPYMRFQYERTKVCCPNKQGETFCSFRGNAFKVDEHRVFRCRWRLVECPNIGCSERVVCSQLLEHLFDCSFKPVHNEENTFKHRTFDERKRTPLAGNLLRMMRKRALSPDSDVERRATVATAAAANNENQPPPRQQRRLAHPVHVARFSPESPPDSSPHPTWLEPRRQLIPLTNSHATSSNNSSARASNNSIGASSTSSTASRTLFTNSRDINPLDSLEDDIASVTTNNDRSEVVRLPPARFHHAPQRPRLHPPFAGYGRGSPGWETDPVFHMPPPPGISNSILSPGVASWPTSTNLASLSSLVSSSPTTRFHLVYFLHCSYFAIIAYSCLLFDHFEFRFKLTLASHCIT